jgi:hypothetical protein
MRFAAFSNGEREGLAVAGSNGEFRGLLSGEAQYPGPLDALVRQGRAALDASAFVLQCGPVVDLDQVKFLPPLPAPGKIICQTIRRFSAASPPVLSLPVRPSSARGPPPNLTMKAKWSQ